jgi:multidrug efflux system membrane fusion protein
LPEKYLPSIQLAMTQQKLGVSAIMANDQGLSSVQDSEEQGKLIFVNNSVDTTSGTIQLKGEFPNTNQALWPGRFVKVKLDLGVEKNAMVLPSKAIQTGQNGDFVFGLAKGKKGLVAVMKPVKVSRLFDDRALLSSGVEVGDQIVVEGASFLQPGKPVTIFTGKRRPQTETALR